MTKPQSDRPAVPVCFCCASRAYGESEALIEIDCAKFCPDVRICCTETEMTLTREDAKRIDALGYSREDYLLRVTGGFCELRNVKGFCYFYSPEEKTCKIYDARPEGCRWYPVIYHSQRRKCVRDSDCPAIETLGRDDIRKVCHKVRSLVEKLREEALHNESPC